MFAVVTCPDCQKPSRIAAAAVGGHVKCPRCASVFRTDGPPAPPIPAAREPEPPAAAFRVEDTAARELLDGSRPVPFSEESLAAPARPREEIPSVLPVSRGGRRAVGRRGAGPRQSPYPFSVF